MRCLIRYAQQDYVCLRNESFEDLMQECLVHWFFIKDQYQPESGASERTFLNRVTRNKIADIVKFGRRNKRKVFYLSESLDAMEDEQSISAKEKALMNEEQVISKITEEDLPEVMAKATTNLSFRQKQICRYLSEGMNQVQVGKKMNMPRTTLQAEMKRIREAFRKAGLEEFLR
ncbi:MAG: sigma-70 family RNA polymerase sigma factor [Candidatus Omnitrophota bacterium]